MPDHNERVPELLVRAVDPVADIGLGDPGWERAEAAKIEKYWSGDTAPLDRQCAARLLWSPEFLFARFDHALREPLLVDSDPDLSTKSIGLWERDVCELFISPENEVPSKYFEFEVAPNGEWLDLSIEATAEGRLTDWDYRSGIKAGSKIEEGTVTMVFRVPWNSIGGAPEPGGKRRGNLFRIVGAGETRGYLAWSPTFTERPDFHVSERFGTFIFM